MASWLLKGLILVIVGCLSPAFFVESRIRHYKFNVSTSLFLFVVEARISLLIEDFFFHPFDRCLILTPTERIHFLSLFVLRNS